MIYKGENFRYNSVRDVCEVDQVGFVDLPDAYANSTVPSIVGEGDLTYNNMEDPCSSMDMPRDVFEAQQQNATVHDYKAPEKDPASKTE